jgi:hypothetical protein
MFIGLLQALTPWISSPGHMRLTPLNGTTGRWMEISSQAGRQCIEDLRGSRYDEMTGGVGDIVEFVPPNNDAFHIGGSLQTGRRPRGQTRKPVFFLTGINSQRFVDAVGSAYAQSRAINEDLPLSPWLRRALGGNCRNRVKCPIAETHRTARKGILITGGVCDWA